ncbi:MAG: hypothetical protein ABEK00_04115 [Candidatus Nanohaloarchaea archaeon]
MREIDKYRYLFAAFLTVLVFGLGFLFSTMMDGQRIDSLQSEMQKSLVELESQNLQLTYLRSEQVGSCSAMETGLTNMIKDYNQMLNRVQQYQKNSILRSEDFSQVKRRYILSGIRYWMFAGDLKEQCNYNPDTVLFFTKSLKSSDCEACRRQGQQLNLLKQKYEESFLIFSVPTSVNDGMVEVLKDQYNITEAPSLVINRDTVIEGYVSRNRIEKYLNNSQSSDNNG